MQTETAFPIGTRLTLRQTFPAAVIKPCGRHRDMGADARHFATVRIEQPDGSTVVDVVHCSPSHPVVA